MAMNIGKEIAAMQRMTVAELRGKYAEVFDEECRSRHKGFLRRRILWGLQAQAEGGLTQRALVHVAGRCPEEGGRLASGLQPQATAQRAGW